MNRLSPTQARRVAYDQAKRAGCTCRPAIAYRPSKIVEVAHDADCPLSNAGQTAALAVTRGDSLLPVTLDLTGAIDLALRGDVMVMGVDEGVIVVPDSLDVPPMIAEFCDIERITRPDGRVVRICSIPDDQVEAMLAQVGGAR